MYEVQKPVQVLNSVHYGVPQARRRMMLVAHKKKNVQFEYPKHTHYYDQEHKENEDLKPFETVESAISDLPKITDNWRVSEVEYSKFEDLTEFQQIMRSNNHNRTVKNNICRMSNDRAKKVFSHMKQGDIYMDLPKEVRQILPFREDIFKDRLKRLVMNKPSWTIFSSYWYGWIYVYTSNGIKNSFSKRSS